MKRPELIARIVLAAAVLGAIAAPLYFRARTPLLHASMAENGGFRPDFLRATVGKPLHLRLTSDDVVHGFAVGHLNMKSVDVLPGKVTEVTLVFDKPGRYTFYCTRWCGLSHWRMRGTIEVRGAGPRAEGADAGAPGKAQKPLYATLGLDLDAPHESPRVPPGSPSAAEGRRLAGDTPIGGFLDPNYYRAHSPYQAWQELRKTPFFSTLDDKQVWNLVAFIWQANTSPAGLANGKKLFAQNCAACHGETGRGDGVFARELAAEGQVSTSEMAGAKRMRRQTPANFTDAKRMLGASPALLQGKILRGGMGTGMPSWGPIFTEDQTWNLTAYLYSIPFQYEETGGPDGQETKQAAGK